MKIFLCVALSCVLMYLVEAAIPTEMTVGVMEGAPLTTAAAQKTLIQTNAEKYMADLKKQLNTGEKYDIIVLPEYGLTGRNYDEKNAIEIDKDNSSSSPDLDYLNKLASPTMIVVANLLEKDDDDIYSTTVALDGSSKLLAKYRKININKTEDNLESADDVVSFVHPTLKNTIGLISGDDILYENPIRKLIENNATTIIYTSSMRSIAPFSVSLSLQAGFAKAEGVNLLVASLSDPKNGTSGSGIFTPCGAEASFINADGLSKALKAKISVTPKDCNAKTLRHGFRTTSLGTETPVQTLLTYDLNGFTTQIVNKSIQNQEVCDGSFCCKFSITAGTWIDSEHYRLAVGGDDQKICALMFCKDAADDIKNCGFIDSSAKATMTFDDISIGTTEDEDLFRPYILHSNLVPDGNIGKVTFSEISDAGTNFTATKVTDAIAVGIVSARSAANTLQILTTNVVILSVLLKYLL
ncbi:vanin-like protein 1 [Coccinella septempunctata]|uniref:vanin-like protein 1 n=1 Tax=Coccinella septempunctata TaxID=41139 RepID=UPI001D06C7A9|nr:vanin-like protein 1 [Coccinella septempunctata]